MSNFICPTCGMNNIDCGKAGYKTDREIELEKKLEIAISALEEYANQKWWDDCITLDDKNTIHPKCAWYNHGYISAQQALERIKGIK